MLASQAVLAIFLLMQGPPAKPTLSVKEVLDRWDAGSRLIDSYDLTNEIKSESYSVKLNGVVRLPFPGESYPPWYSYSHIFKSGDKRFGEFIKGKDGSYDHQLSFDGTMLTAGWFSENQFALQQYCEIFGSTQLEDYETLYRTVRGSADRVAMSRERSARLLPREGNLYVIEVPPGKPGPWWEITWKVWLDPSRNFMPTKWSDSIVKSGRSIRDRDCAIELAEVVPGVWAPVEAKLSVYNKNPDSPIFDKVGGVDFLKVDRAKSRFNIAIPDDQFVIKIPNGASVIDRTRNVVYTQGASDPDAYLAELAAKGRGAVAGLPKHDPNSKSLVFVPDQPRFWTNGWTIAAGVAALVVTLLAAIAIRRSKGLVA